MIIKEFVKAVSHIVVIFALFMIYAQYFGQQSVQRYLEEGVTTVKYKETLGAIPPPGRCMKSIKLII